MANDHGAFYNVSHNKSTQTKVHKRPFRRFGVMRWMTMVPFISCRITKVHQRRFRKFGFIETWWMTMAYFITCRITKVHQRRIKRSGFIEVRWMTMVGFFKICLIPKYINCELETK